MGEISQLGKRLQVFFFPKKSGFMVSIAIFRNKLEILPDFISRSQIY